MAGRRIDFITCEDEPYGLALVVNFKGWMTCYQLIRKYSCGPHVRFGGVWDNLADLKLRQSGCALLQPSAWVDENFWGHIVESACRQIA